MRAAGSPVHTRVRGQGEQLRQETWRTAAAALLGRSSGVERLGRALPQGRSPPTRARHAPRVSTMPSTGSDLHHSSEQEHRGGCGLLDPGVTVCGGLGVAWWRPSTPAAPVVPPPWLYFAQRPDSTANEPSGHHLPSLSVSSLPP